MKTFYQSILIIISTLVLMMLVSLLFNLAFIQQHIARQLIIWLLETIILFIGFRLLQEAQKTN